MTATLFNLSLAFIFLLKSNLLSIVNPKYFIVFCIVIGYPLHDNEVFSLELFMLGEKTIA